MRVDMKRTLLAGCVMLASVVGAQAQGFPSKPVTVVIPLAAGGAVDTMVRTMTDAMRSTLGQPILVENMGGAGGVIGATSVARAPADGYTLLLGTTSELVISPLLGKLPYDPVTSFEPIAIMCDSPAAIVVHPSVPVSNLKELVEYAKQHKNLNYGSAGAGTVSNLAGELFKSIADLPDIVHVPYKGGAPAVSDAIAGQIPISTPMMSEQIWEFHKQGKLKVLAVLSEKRLRALPDLPTAVEQGYPDLVARLAFGLFAPAKTPKEIISKVEQATKVTMQDPELKKNFEAGGFETLDTIDSAAAADYVAKEVARWKPILAQFKPQ